MNFRTRSSLAWVAWLALLLVALPAAAATAGQDAIERIQAAIREGNRELAVTLAREAVVASPDEAWSQMWLGHAYRLTGDLAAAQRAYMRASRVEPENAEILMGIAEVFEAAGNLSQARAGYDRVITLAPAVAPPYRSAATLWMRAGDYDRAAGYLTTFVEMRPDDLDALYLLGVSRFFSGDHDGAIEALEGLLGQLPDSIPANYTLGVVLADRPDEHERALSLLQRAVEAGHEVADASYLIGRILADRGDVEEALPALEHSLEVNPDQLDATYRLARAYARLGRREEGAATMQRFQQMQQAFNAAEAADKRLKTSQNELAAALEAGDAAAADRVLQTLVADNPDNPQILVQAAKVWLSAGAVGSARDAALAAGQLDPENWEAAFIEGLIHQRDGRLPEALEALRRALRINPVFADSWMVLGNTQLAGGNAGSAVAAYLAAIDLDADNPGYWLNLATAYGRLGRGDLEAEALDTYRRLSERKSPQP